MSEYTKMANDFCKKTGTKITITYLDCVKNPWGEAGYTSNWYHNQYMVRIDRNHKTMYIKFTDSKVNTDSCKRPTKYDVLACLTKWDYGSFEEFCSEMGYEVYDFDSYSRNNPNYYNMKAMKTYKAIQKEYNNVMRLFGDVIEELAEIA